MQYNRVLSIFLSKRQNKETRLFGFSQIPYVVIVKKPNSYLRHNNIAYTLYNTSGYTRRNTSQRVPIYLCVYIQSNITYFRKCRRLACAIVFNSNNSYRVKRLEKLRSIFVSRSIREQVHIINVGTILYCSRHRNAYNSTSACLSPRVYTYVRSLRTMTPEALKVHRKVIGGGGAPGCCCCCSCRRCLVYTYIMLR